MIEFLLIVYILGFGYTSLVYFRAYRLLGSWQNVADYMNKVNPKAKMTDISAQWTVAFCIISWPITLAYVYLK